ncbi:MAG: outer membrane protein (OmpH-like) [Bacteroidetes bacterium]|nr:outer membrane protein (OmpH-like) [Bacteroidota bacterium]
MKSKMLLVLLALCPVMVFGQKMAYVYSDSVLLSVPGYKQKTSKIDSLRQVYTKEINAGIAGMQGQYDKLIEPYALKKNETLPEVKKRMSVSDTLRLGLLEKEAVQWQGKRMSYERMLQNQYNQDIQPLLDKVNKVIAEYAKTASLSAVYSFEQLRSALVYIDPKQNITDIIIRRLKQ